MSADAREELLGWLRNLEAQLAAGEDPSAEVALVYLAHQDVVIDEDELHGALRRAILLRATGGDPYRDIELDERAVEGLADDLDEPARRSELLAALVEIAELVAGLPHLERVASELLADPEHAWRLLAVALLADHLSSDDDV